MSEDIFYKNIQTIRNCLTSEWQSRDDFIKESRLSGLDLFQSLKHLVDTGRAEAKNSSARSRTGCLTKGWRRKDVRIKMCEFRCKACGNMRPDHFLSVKTVDTSSSRNFPEGSIKENFQYCNDKDSCRDTAMKFKGHCLGEDRDGKKTSAQE